jgi:hypothetical protein
VLFRSVVYLNDYTRTFILKYGQKEESPESLVINIIEANMSESDQRMKVKNFTRLLNKNIQKIEKANKLPKFQLIGVGTPLQPMQSEAEHLYNRSVRH